MLGPDGGTGPFGSMFRIIGPYFPPATLLSLGSARFKEGSVAAKLLSADVDVDDVRRRNTSSSIAARCFAINS